MGITYWYLWIAVVPLSSAAKVYKSCNEWFVSGYTGSGSYLLDVDGDASFPPFQVYCDMSGTEPRTVLHHDSELPANISGIGSFTLNVTYNPGLSSVLRLIGVAAACTQKLEYQCYASALSLSSQASFWLSGTGQQVYYWGGGDGFIGHCECGINGTCVSSGLSTALKCNCDARDQTWRRDGGQLTDLSLLPVTAVYISDVNSASDGVVSVGPLICTDIPSTDWLQTSAGIATVVCCSLLALCLILLLVLVCVRYKLHKRCHVCCIETLNINKGSEYSENRPTMVVGDDRGNSGDNLSFANKKGSDLKGSNESWMADVKHSMQPPELGRLTDTDRSALQLHTPNSEWEVETIAEDSIQETSFMEFSGTENMGGEQLEGATIGHKATMNVHLVDDEGEEEYLQQAQLEMHEQSQLGPTRLRGQTKHYQVQPALARYVRDRDLFPNLQT